MEIETIGAFESFLRWGPLGLAGLMLVLVIFALSTGKLTPERSKLLRTFMFVGAGCFVAALVAQYFAGEGKHRVVLSVLPNDLDGSSFPPPKIQANGQDVDRRAIFFVTEATALSIDVSRAVGLYQTTAQQAQEAEQKVVTAESELVSANQKVEEAQEMIEQQNQSLEQALAATETLQTQVRSLSTSRSIQDEAPVELQRIEREIQSLQRNIQTGVFR
ncbi:MAG: hypothetical protein AAF496_02310 [Pseudomonadota bacterium]